MMSIKNSMRFHKIPEIVINLSRKARGPSGNMITFAVKHNIAQHRLRTCVTINASANSGRHEPGCWRNDACYHHSSCATQLKRIKTKREGLVHYDGTVMLHTKLSILKEG